MAACLTCRFGQRRTVSTGNNRPQPAAPGLQAPDIYELPRSGHDDVQSHGAGFLRRDRGAHPLHRPVHADGQSNPKSDVRRHAGRGSGHHGKVYADVPRRHPGAYDKLGRLEDGPLVTGYQHQRPQSCAPFNDILNLASQSGSVGYCFQEHFDHMSTIDLPDEVTRPMSWPG